MLKRSLLIALLPALMMAQAPNPVYRFHTTSGDIDVVLTPNVAPNTVANFLAYLNAGAYTNTVFHRLVPGFIIQAGGYQLQSGSLVATAQNAPVVNEFNVSNTAGTIAMAKLGSDPNSATNQWFFNLANNGANLDNQNGGFTVFGHVANAAGLAVLGKLGALAVVNDGSPFDALPLNKDGSYVLVSSIVPVPAITVQGFESAASSAQNSKTGVSPGEILTIYGQNLGPAQLATLALDANGNVTNSLGGTQVLFDGVAAPMIFTTSTQISAVVPYAVAGKTSTNVTVTYQGVSASVITFPVVAANPAIFTLNQSGSGDGAIERPNGNVITSSNPAVPGETLVLYGEGYGVASPALPDGAIVGSTLPVPAVTPVLTIDGQTVPTTYAGGTPTLINGVLQVNFVVPALSAGAHSIQLSVGGRTSPAGVNLQTK